MGSQRVGHDWSALACTHINPEKKHQGLSPGEWAGKWVRTSPPLPLVSSGGYSEKMPASLRASLSASIAGEEPRTQTLEQRMCEQAKEEQGLKGEPSLFTCHLWTSWKNKPCVTDT